MVDWALSPTHEALAQKGSPGVGVGVGQLPEYTPFSVLQGKALCLHRPQTRLPRRWGQSVGLKGSFLRTALGFLVSLGPGRGADALLLKDTAPTSALSKLAWERLVCENLPKEISLPIIILEAQGRKWSKEGLDFCREVSQP